MYGLLERQDATALAIGTGSVCPRSWCGRGYHSSRSTAGHAPQLCVLKKRHFVGIYSVLVAIFFSFFSFLFIAFLFFLAAI